MSAAYRPGSIVISRMGLIHKIASSNSLLAEVTLMDGRTLPAINFTPYDPASHGPIGNLEVCAECIPEMDS